MIKKIVVSNDNLEIIAKTLNKLFSNRHHASTHCWERSKDSTFDNFSDYLGPQTLLNRKARFNSKNYPFGITYDFIRNITIENKAGIGVYLLFECDVDNFTLYVGDIVYLHPSGKMVLYFDKKNHPATDFIGSQLCLFVPIKLTKTIEREICFQKEMSELYDY